MTEITDRLYTPQEVADRFKISKMSVLRAFKRGDLKGVQLSERIIRFTEEQIRRWRKVENSK